MLMGSGRSGRTETVVAGLETSPGSGVFVIDDRLRVDEVVLGVDESIGRARMAVRIDDSFDTAAARLRYQADLRVVVRTDEADPADRVVLFEGYPPVQSARWRGGPGGGEESFGFTAIGVYERLSRERRSMIQGRRMRTGTIADGLAVDPATWAGRSGLVRALPCVFNVDGVANAAAVPLSVTDRDGVARSIRIFTHDDDPSGVAWTYGDAVRYLAWFYALAGGPVFVRDLLDATEGVGLASRARLAGRLAVACDTLNCEATNLVEALSMVAEAAGVHFSVDARADGAGVRSELQVWAAGDQARRQLHLVRGGRYADGVPRYDVTQLDGQDVLRANEVSAADIQWDYRRIVNAPVVIGDVKGYEMTVPLWPGWLPTVNLDNVGAGSRDAAKALALTPGQVTALGNQADGDAWYRKYHRDGSEHADHRYVGRRWVLNEDGRFDGATYNRDAPFDAYGAFDFSTVAGAVTRRGAWSRRSRALLPTITRTKLGAGFGFFVEISFDGGTTWHLPGGAVRVVRGPTGVVFEAANPTQVTPPGVESSEQNLWYALIDQTLRVRVTAVIESDERVTAMAGPVDSRSPTLLTTSVLVYRPGRYKFATRLNTTNVLAGVNAGGAGIERDDTAVVGLAAETLARRGQDRRVIASPVIPWMDRTFAIGDEIERVRGRGVSFVTREDEPGMGPVVVGKRYRFDGGRWETRLLLAHDEASVGEVL